MSLTQPVSRAAGGTSASEPPQPPRSVTLRAVLLALLLMPVNAYWVIQMERVRYSAHPTTISLFFNVVFILVVLCGVNAFIGKTPFKRWQFSRGELLLIYSMLCLGSCMAAHDFIQVLVPHLTWLYHEATASNQYRTLVQPYIPTWAAVPNAGDGFYLGEDTFYRRDHIMAWLPAILVWTTFVAVLLFTMQCVNVLIRKQWSEHEHLSFPLAKIPLQVTDVFSGDSQGAPFRMNNRLFWIGFGLAVTMDLVNSLNYYYPSVPPILTPGSGQSMDLANYVKTPPWSAIGWTPLAVYPFVVGLGMLMPLDFLFSSWFFYIFWKLQLVAVSAFGWNTDSQMPYANAQSFGAYMLFFTSTLWLSRHYLKQVIAKALGRQSDLDDSDEPLSYRGAFLGFAIGLGALIVFSMVLGLSWWLAIAFFVVYLALALAITRMRVELGTPVHDLHFTGPDFILTTLIGPHAMGAQNTSVMSLYYWFNRAYRAHPMPFQMEAFRLAELTGRRREMRKWFWALMLAGVVGMLSAFWATLVCYYHYGAQAKIQYTFGAESWDRYVGWMKGFQPTSPRFPAAIAVGYLFATFLQVMRVRYSWWPFHPLAYAVTSSWEINLLWLSLFIAWLIKSILLRYGGVTKYQQSLPLFYGLILGQFIYGSLLNIWGICFKVPTYQFWQ